MKESIGQSFVIAPATKEELTLAANLRFAMAVEGGANWDVEHPGWRERYVEYFSKKQDDNLGEHFVARWGDQVVGMAAVSVPEDYHAFVRGKFSGRINSVYVMPEYRRRGIARALMRATMEWLKRRGCVGVRLNSSEDGLALYQSLGFKPRREMEFLFDAGT